MRAHARIAPMCVRAANLLSTLGLGRGRGAQGRGAQGTVAHRLHAEKGYGR